MYVLIDNSYVMIRILNQEKVEIYCFNQINNNKTIYTYPICFVTYCVDIDRLFILLSMSIIIQHLCTSHKLYLGKEILKANICTSLKQLYIQS
uniref:hypothetical protein n=1 Tax=Lophurella stichidiosa TaxID=2008659 RepID=UPI002551FC3C|nr:hypothetical protein QQP86_pgp135 [Aphanocladia stichidiosa]WGH14037.1 hypothetical protein [Aphanocladia stichidiosa]